MNSNYIYKKRVMIKIQRINYNINNRFKIKNNKLNNYKYY